MEDNLEKKVEEKSKPKNFPQKYIVGIIIFSVWTVLALFNMLSHISRPAEAFGGLVIDIVTGAIIASIVQLVFTGLRKLFEKKPTND